MEVEEEHQNKIVTIVVPIYNGYNVTKECLNSIIEKTNTPYDLILINDASTDCKILPLLNTYEKKYSNIRIINNPHNLGYTATINIGCNNCSTDVVLLNSDTIVTRNWLQKLSKSAYVYKNIATVTPLSNSAGAFSVPFRGIDYDLPSGITIEMMSNIIEQLSSNIYPIVPTGNGFCLYLRRECIQVIGLFDEINFARGYCEENDLCMRAQKKGYLNIIDDSTFIYHRRNISFGDEKQLLIKKNRKTLDILHPDFKKKVDSWLKHDELSNFRKQIEDEINKNKRSALKNILVILHDCEGGTNYTTEDLISNISSKFNVFILKLNIRYWDLYSYEGSNLNLISRYKFTQGWKFLSNRWRINECLSKDREKLINNLLETYNINIVHIRHLIGSSPEIIDEIKRKNIPIVFSFHDFYTICPTIQLINNEERFCGGRCNQLDNTDYRVSKTWFKNIFVRTDCRVSKTWFKNIPRLKNSYVHEWRQRVAKSLHKVDICVTTSHSAKKLILEFFPFLNEKFLIIEHGRDFDNYYHVSGKKSDTKKILLIGALGPAKGINTISKIMELNKKNNSGIEFHFLGNIPNNCNYKSYGGYYHGTYERENLPELVNAIKPTHSMIFSIWPETFCHTLTESWALGLPVFASDIGVLKERIENNGGGWLLNHEDPDMCYQDIMKVIYDKSEYTRKKNEISRMIFKTSEEMSEEYMAEYKNLLIES